MTSSEITLAAIGLITPVMLALLGLVYKLHCGRVDSLDKREHDNNIRHLNNHAALTQTITEERRIAEERDSRVFEKLDKVTEKIGALHTSIAGNFVSKEDCGRCKDSK